MWLNCVIAEINSVTDLNYIGNYRLAYKKLKTLYISGGKLLEPKLWTDIKNTTFTPIKVKVKRLEKDIIK